MQRRWLWPWRADGGEVVYHHLTLRRRGGGRVAVVDGEDLNVWVGSPPDVGPGDWGAEVWFGADFGDGGAAHG